MIHTQTASFADPGLPAHRAQAAEIVQRAPELRHRQAGIKTIVSSTTDCALLTVDPAGGVQHCNAGTARVTGCAAEAAGRNRAEPWRSGLAPAAQAAQAAQTAQTARTARTARTAVAP